MGSLTPSIKKVRMKSASVPHSRTSFWLALLVAFHILVIIASNYLVQLPIELFGFHSTWGAFSFPFIFLATDLTVRLIGKTPARRVILRAMVPALVVSYVVSVLFHEGGFKGFEALTWWGFLAPAGTPTPALQRLNAEINRALTQPDLRARLTASDNLPTGGSAADFARQIATESEHNARIIKAAAIRAE